MATDPTTKILLVDDQPANLAVLQAVLANVDAQLVSVTSGEAALREVLAHDFAVVLLDVRMPGMDGFELADLIRQHPRTQGLPIIFLTAADSDELPVERAYALGAVDFLAKPLNPVVLRAKVAVFIDLFRKGVELARMQEARHRKALRSRDARLRLILDNIRDYAFIGTDPERRVTEWEAGAAAITGWRADQMLGQSVDALFLPEDRAAGAPEREAAHALEHGSAPDRRWHMRSDGTRFFADGVMVALRDDAGHLAGFAKIVRDATAEQEARERLAHSEHQLVSGRRKAAAERERLLAQLQAASERMRDIFHRAPAIMGVMRGAGHTIELANQRYLDLAGGRPLAGRALLDALPELEGQGFVELLDGVVAEGRAAEGSDMRLLLRARDGRAGHEELFLDFACMPLREPDGAVSGVLLHAVDVTERMRANLLAVGQRGALELAVTDAPLGDVLDVLAHTAEDYAGGAAQASVQLATVDGRRLRHAAAPSLPAAFQQAVDAIPVGPDGGAAGRAAAQAGAVTCADVDTDPAWSGHRDLPRAHGLLACRALPILAPAGAVLGTFTLYYRDRRAPSAAEEAALALLANTASLVIGQRHEAAERQAAEHRSRAILESMSEGFVALDADGRVGYANSAAEALTGLRRDDLVGRAPWDLMPALAGSSQERELRRAIAARGRARVEVFDAADGRWFEINAFPMEGPGTDGIGTALYFRDETERRRAEEGIRRLAAVAEQSSDFIGIFMPDAGGLYLNPAGRRMAGLDEATNIGAWRMIDFFPREDRAFVRAQVLAALTGAAAQWEGELRLAQPDGRAPLPVYFKGFAVRDADGNNIGLATITRDITQQKRAEDELRRVAADLSEADHRKSEFLATLAHELRNPLAPIRTGLDLLRMAPHGGDAGAAARIHGMMDRQLGHLIHLVDDLLDIARITRGKIELKKEAVRLDTIVHMAVETSMGLVTAHGHRLAVELPPEPLDVEADVTRLVQVLSNLLNNAAKYTPAGGAITLSAWREDGHAVVAVTDTGVGIAAEAIGSVFEMFTQVRGSLDRAQGGLGIGLSLVRRLVELHGGRVGAFSGGSGQGSTFTLRLPLRRGTPHARTAAPAPGAAAPAGPLRVLVVDDNADAAESLVALLQVLGHTTNVAHDGPQGLHAAEEWAPDLVFLDIGLPGMSGYEVARAIRQRQGLRQVVLIALTGWGAQSDQQQSHEAGFDQHLTKPVSLEALEQALGAAARALP